MTDSLVIPEEKRFPGLTVLGIAPLLAEAIRTVQAGGSVRAMQESLAARE
ncbi:MAG: hypothetical protein HY320_03240 [Armatimonadetes bacterium]|nr:hypothetical protein [Armatimonadota bacterium]